MIEIKKLSGENVKLTRDTHFSYIADYGFQTRGFDSNFTVEVKSEEDIKDFLARGSCGCVTVKKDKLDNFRYNLKIRYDSNLLGRIIKTVWININGDKWEIKLRGSVRN